MIEMIMLIDDRGNHDYGEDNFDNHGNHEY